MRKMVYIAHPLRGPDTAANVEKITAICRTYAEHDTLTPVSPIHALGFLDPNKFDAYKGLQFCLSLLSRCDELHVHGVWQNSEGCKAEIAFAKCRGIKVVLFW